MFATDKPVAAGPFFKFLNPREGLDSVELFEFYYSINRQLLKFSGIVTLLEIFPDRAWVNRLFFVLVIIAAQSILIPECYALISRPSSIGKILEVVGTNLVVFNSCCKIAILTYHRDAVIRQEKIWKKLWKETVSLEEISRLCDYAKKGKALTIYWLVLAFLFVVVYLTSPLIVSLRNNFENGTATPFLVALEIESNFTLLCVYLWQTLASCTIYISVVGPDLAIIVMVLHACGHFKVLQFRLRSIKKHSVLPMKFISSYDGKEIILDEQDVVYNLKECIKRHQVILNACSDIERSLNLLGLAEGLFAVYHVCLSGIGILVAPEETFKFCVHIGCALYHLFLFCWPSDDLMTQSLEVANAAFYLPWYHCSQSVQTTALIMISRAQRSCQWTAGRYFVLSLQTFATLVYNAFSAFAVLRTVM